jgi:hypothetical protein
MRPPLPPIAIAIAAVLASAPCWAQQPPASSVASPATALAAPPPRHGAPATSVRPPSAFGQAIAELTRSMRTAKPAPPVEAPRAPDSDAGGEAAALATTDPDGR